MPAKLLVWALDASILTPPLSKACAKVRGLTHAPWNSMRDGFFLIAWDNNCLFFCGRWRPWFMMMMTMMTNDNDDDDDDDGFSKTMPCIINAAVIQLNTHWHLSFQICASFSKFCDWVRMWLRTRSLSWQGCFEPYEVDEAWKCCRCGNGENYGGGRPNL